jgi:hypothetical protein
MKLKLSTLRVAMAALAIGLAAPAFAGPGHDHDEAPAAAGGSALPKFDAHSDLFEVVATLHADELSVTVDRYADNSPVLKAAVSLESGSIKADGTFHEDHGDYSFDAAPFRQPGTYPVVLTITASGDTDILAGELVVAAADAGHGHAAHGGWQRWAAIAAALLAVLAVAAFAVRAVRRRTTRSHA